MRPGRRTHSYYRWLALLRIEEIDHCCQTERGDQGGVVGLEDGGGPAIGSALQHCGRRDGLFGELEIGLQAATDTGARGARIKIEHADRRGCRRVRGPV